jgi:hypothetical protein
MCECRISSIIIKASFIKGIKLSCWIKTVKIRREGWIKGKKLRDRILKLKNHIKSCIILRSKRLTIKNKPISCIISKNWRPTIVKTCRKSSFMQLINPVLKKNIIS